MDMVPSFSKVFALGGQNVEDLLERSVHVKEKVDGSQFGFCYDRERGEVLCRSRNQQLVVDHPDEMFRGAVEHVRSMEDQLRRIDEDVVFYGECLRKPKHNMIPYGRVPRNHIALFAVYWPRKHLMLMDDPILGSYADLLDVDRVPELLPLGTYDVKDIEKLLETESFLGGGKIEGVVVSVSEPWYWAAAGVQYPARFGKLVRPEFKERLNRDWKKENTSKGKLQAYINSFAAEPRWDKAVQHLRDDGTLLNDPKDIGVLMREVHRDIEEEHAEEIKEFLYRLFIKDVKRSATRGLPGWYKGRLAGLN